MTNIQAIVRLSALMAVIQISFWGPSALAATEDQCRALALQDFSRVPDAPTRITASTVVPAQGAVPSYCRVEAYIAPQVGYEGHLPLDNWNGKFVFQGCGAMCGSLQGLSSCPAALAQGYACATTDMGHRAPSQDGKWAYQNPVAEIDVGHRATHVATVAGKAIAENFYGADIKRSYFQGCSTGGRQALVEANRYPLDYDGILGGAPVLYSPMGPPLQLFWDVTANIGPDGKPILDPAKLPILAKAVMNACDATDGLKDGTIGDPRACKFDPAALKCSAGQSSECLTSSEIDVVRKLYEGPRTSKGLLKRVGGQPFGTELSWAGFIAGRNSANYNWANENLRYLAFPLDPGPGYDVSQFDWDRDPQRLSYSHMTAANPDLELFAENGGKLILFHGWADPAIPATVTIGYYEQLTRTMRGPKATKDFARLFLLPGMGHCRGGGGATYVDMLAELDAWVEGGKAPDQLMSYAVPDTGPNEAPKGYNGRNIQDFKPKFTRPLFPYPEQAHFSGKGDPNDAKNFKRVSSDR